MLEKEDSFICFDLNIGQNYLSDWSISFALREIIANALDEQIDENIKAEATNDGTIIIRDWGRGLRPEHFVYQEFGKKNRKDKIGKFGVGLKDAIGVLWSRNINIEIRSNGYEFTFGMKEKFPDGDCKTLHVYIKEIKDDNFVGTEFIIHNCPNTDFKEAKQQFIRFQELEPLFTSTKGQIINKGISEAANIYVNGMKIAESNLRFSYNITSPSSKVLKGINRERNYVSRSVYQNDIVKILKQVNEKVVLDILEDQLLRTFDNENLVEITWKDVIVKTCNYVIKKGHVVFISNDDIEKSTEVYNLVCQNKEIKIIKVSPMVKKTLKSKRELLEKTTVFLEDLELDIHQTFSLEELTEEENKVLNNVISLFKSINVLKNEHYLLDNLHISKESRSYIDQNESTIIIPRNCLKSIERCSSELINALASIRQGSNQFKDYVIGELCSEFIRNKSDI